MCFAGTETTGGNPSARYLRLAVLVEWLPGRVIVSADAPTEFVAALHEIAPRSIALSGGSTAARCYRELGAQGLPDSLHRFYWSDERFVSVSDPDSNEGLSRKTFLDDLSDVEVFSMRGSADTVEQAASEYDALVSAALPIDVVHLGVGPDGHTASLFPDSPDLKIDNHLVISTGDDQHPHRRISFTYAGIARCRWAVVTVVGAEKRPAMASMRDGEDLPSMHIGAENILWIIDEAALPA